MARPGWYNENSGRDFPFVFSRGESATTGYLAIKEATDVFVDFGCVIGIHADFVEGEHSVWLAKITLLGNYIEIDFYSDAPGLAEYKLQFTREIGDTDYEIEYAQVVPKDYSSVSLVEANVQPYCSGDVLWEGFLVTKNVARLLTYSPLTELTFDDGDLPVEPGLIQNLAGHYMSSLNAFNADRTRGERVDGCIPWCWPDARYGVYQYWHVELCMTGDIRIAEGYNITIEEDLYNNRLTFNAEVGKGEGEPPGEMQHFPTEDYPEYGSYLDGSVGCDEVVRTINGIEGPHVEIIGGQGITVETIPGQHLVVVKIDMQDLTGCFEQEASTSLTEYVPDPDPCACGDQ